MQLSNVPLSFLPAPGARPQAMRLRVLTMKESLFATSMVPSPEGDGGAGAVPGCRSDCRT